MHHGLVRIIIGIVSVVVAVAIVRGTRARPHLEQFPSNSRRRTAVFVLGTFESLPHFLRRFPVLVVFVLVVVRRGLFANTKACLFRGAFGFSKHDCVVLCYGTRTRTRM